MQVFSEYYHNVLKQLVIHVDFYSFYIVIILKTNCLWFPGTTFSHKVSFSLSFMKQYKSILFA